MAGCHDLVAVGAVYHHSCSTNFITGIDFPCAFNSCDGEKERKQGRPFNKRQRQGHPTRKF